MIDAFIELPLIAEILLAISTIAGMAWAAVKFIFPVARETFEALSGLMAVGARAGDLIASIDDQRKNAQMLEQIRHEVLPNGSGSLRDAVTRTEGKVNLLIGQQRARADADDDTATMDASETGQVEWLSRAVMVWTRRTSDELKGYGWISSIHPDEREDVAEEWSRCVRHRRQFDAAFRLVGRDGDTTLVRMSGVTVSAELDGIERGPVRWAIMLTRIDRAPESLAAPERANQSRSPS